jgi:hypothetical protein
VEGDDEEAKEQLQTSRQDFRETKNKMHAQVFGYES